MTNITEVIIHPFRKNHLLLLLTILSLSTSLPHHHHHTIRSKYPPHSSEDENPPEDEYENPYQIFSDDPSEYYSGEMASDPPPPVYGMDEPPTPDDDVESQGTTTTEGFDDEMKDDEFDHEEDEDEMENRDRRDLLRGQRQARPSKNARCSKLNGQIKCSKRRQSLGPSNKQVLRTSRSFMYPLQHKREVKPKNSAEKEWKSFKNKEELFNYIEDIVLKPNLPPDESTNKQGKKNKKIKSTINPSTTNPTVKVDHTDPQDFQNSWVNFQKWMRNQLDQPGRRLEFESEFSKNQNRRNSIQTLGELSNKDKGKTLAEVANTTTQVPIVETPFVFLDNPPQKVERYDFGPFKGTKYIEKTKDSSQMVFDKTIEEPAKTNVFPDVSRNPVSSKGVAEDVKQLQITTMNDNITVGGNTKKEVKTTKTTSGLEEDVKAELPIPDPGKDNLANGQPDKNVIQSMLNKNGFIFSNIQGNQSENNQISKEKVFEYKFKVSSIEDKLIIPDPSKYGALFFNSTFNHQNSTTYPYNHPHIYNATPAMDDVFTAVFSNTEPADFLPHPDSYSSTIEPPYTMALNKNESTKQLDMVIKLPENAFKEMEESIRNRNKVIMKLDFERPDSKHIRNGYNDVPEGVSTIKPVVTTIDVPKTSTVSKLDVTDLYQDETSNSFTGQDGINMLKFAVKLTENMQESVNQRKDLSEAEKVLLYNIILQKFMKLLAIDIDLMSKNE